MSIQTVESYFCCLQQTKVVLLSLDLVLTPGQKVMVINAEVKSEYIIEPEAFFFLDSSFELISRIIMLRNCLLKFELYILLEHIILSV